MDSERNEFEEKNPYACYYGTGAPRRRRGHGGWLIFFTVLLILMTAGALLGKRYRIQLYTGSDGISLSVARRDVAAVEENPAVENSPVGEETVPVEEEPAPDTETPVQAGVGTGAQLEISDRTPVSTTADPDENDGALTLQQIYQKMIPSVASIITVTDSGTASGTGIIMTEDGYIITNNHVVDGGRSFTVLLSDDAQYEAFLVGGDSVSDLAVLKIDAAGLHAAEFGNSDEAEVGDTVVAIGDPLGIELRGTMTDGIISAINRDLTTNGRTLTLLQTNAQLNNGNSGGPLINIYGQVIGINTMKMGSYYSTSVEGIGFAIPIATAKPIVDELIEKGYVSGRPAIGIQGEAVPTYVQAYYKMPNGVYVAYVYSGSDAAAKGLSEGDIITAIDGVNVSSMDELNAVKNQHVAGDTVRLNVYRGGKTYEVDIVLMDQNDAD